MKYCTIFIFVLISLQYSIVYGQYKAVYIPDSMLVKIKIDGDTSDWNWVPQKYLITERSMVKNIFANNNFWKCRIKVGWSDLNHKLYIIAKITDDIFISNNSLHYLNDCMQFAINADNEGGLYRFVTEEKYSRIKNSTLCALAPTSDGNFKLLIDGGSDWMQDKQHIDWSVKHYKNKNGKYETTYEICLSLWDKWESEGQKYSFPTKLYPFKKIRLALTFNDSDVSDGTFTEWSNLAGREWWMNADDIPKFTLDVPLKTGISWQGVRYIVNHQ